MRLDSELVSREFYTTRARAVAAINAGLVTVNGVPAKKPSQKIGEADVIEAGALPYLSGRGSLKLAAALDAFEINPRGMICLDIGASTGGFTEVLLARGAQKVIAIEVGTAQMVPELRTDTRVISMENTDIRTVVPHSTVDLVVIDVSFISLNEIADAVAKWNAPRIIALIKPQFEVPRSIAAKYKGIIKSAEHHDFAIKNATDAFGAFGYKCGGLIESPVKGGSGNVEFLGLFVKQ